MEEIDTPTCSLLDYSKLFTSPMEGSEVFSRTGVINDHLSFLHAVIMSYFIDYEKLSVKNRLNMAEQLLEKIIDCKEDNSYRLNFQSSFIKLLHKNFKETDFKNITEQDIIKKICEKSWESKKVEKSLLILSDSFCKKNFGNNKKRVDNFLNFIEDLIIKTKEKCHNKFISNIRDFEKLLSSEMLQKITNILNRDIFVLNIETGMPISNLCSSDKKERKAIVIASITVNGKTRYESIGKIIDDEITQRQFLHDDLFIQKIKTFIFAPETIFKKFPSLLKYLPKDYKKTDINSPRAIFRNCEDKREEESSESSSSSSSSSEEISKKK